MRVCRVLQCGDKAGTVRGQYHYVKKITHSHTYSPFFRLPLSLAFAGFCLPRLNRWRWCPVLVFCSSEQRPAHGFDGIGPCLRCGRAHACTLRPVTLLFVLVRCSMPRQRTRTHDPGNGREGLPSWPHLWRAALLCGLLYGLLCGPVARAGGAVDLMQTARAWWRDPAPAKPSPSPGAVPGAHAGQHMATACKPLTPKPHPVT